MRNLVRSLESGDAIVAGVLSGTSGDGVDVVIARLGVTGSGESSRPQALEQLAFACTAFPDELGRRVRAVLDGVPPSLGEIALLHRDLGLAFGQAVSALAQESGLAPILVGSHGQTVWHHDGAEPGERATLQLGDADHVAQAAGCWVASDFRQADIASGGEGAPLSALVESLLFPGLARPAAVLNLGGIGNLTILGDSDEPLAAFDTGPAGCLLDGLARRLIKAPMDRGGARASMGTVDEDLLKSWMQHPFFSGDALSTGRDTFGEEYVTERLEEARSAGVLEADSILATAAAFVAEAVSRGLKRRGVAGLEGLIVAGGGVHNVALTKELQLRTGFRTVSSAEMGVDPDAREALGFAAMGAGCALRWAWNSPRGPKNAENRVLGRLSPPPPNPPR
jgi:anhydro-N-acetylmuramic acid kinase